MESYVNSKLYFGARELCKLNNLFLFAVEVSKIILRLDNVKMQLL